MRNLITISQFVVKELIRRKDFYFILSLLLVMIFFASSASFGGEVGFSRYFKEIGLTLVYAFSVVIAVSFAARQIPDEVESKTAYVVLTRPLSRLQFIVGKFLGVFFISAVSFTVFYGVLIAALLMRNDHTTPPVLILEGYLLALALLSFMTSLTILLSLYLSAMANTSIALIVYLGSTWFGANVSAYIFLPHPELFDIKDRFVHSSEIIPAWVVSFLLVYAAIYTASFLMLGNLTFRKRNL